MALRVLVTHERFPPDYGGGGEYVALRTAQGLIAAGVDVQVLTAGDPAITMHEGVPTTRLPTSRYGFNLRMPWGPQPAARTPGQRPAGAAGQGQRAQGQGGAQGQGTGVDHVVAGGQGQGVIKGGKQAALGELFLHQQGAGQDQALPLLGRFDGQHFR